MWGLRKSHEHKITKRKTMTFEKTAQISFKGKTWETLDGTLDRWEDETPCPELTAVQKQMILDEIEDEEAIGRITHDIIDEVLEESTFRFGATKNFIFQECSRQGFCFDDQFDQFTHLQSNGTCWLWRIWEDGLSDLFESETEESGRELLNQFIDFENPPAWKREVLEAEFSRLKAKGNHFRKESNSIED